MSSSIPGFAVARVSVLLVVPTIMWYLTMGAAADVRKSGVCGHSFCPPGVSS